MAALSMTRGGIEMGVEIYQSDTARAMHRFEYATAATSQPLTDPQPAASGPYGRVDDVLDTARAVRGEIG